MADMTPTHPAPLSEEEVSALFAQLEELIPQVEQAAADDARVQRARQAAQIFPVAEELRKARILLDSQLADLEAEKRAVRQAQADGDANAAGFHGFKLKSIGEQVDFAKAPVQRAEQVLEDMIAHSPFASWEEAQSALMDEEECQRLAAHAEAVRQEYARVFNLCSAYAE